jgi:UDP-N-acetylmuramyl tripeptide synthase
MSQSDLYEDFLMTDNERYTEPYSILGEVLEPFPEKEKYSWNNMQV